MFQTTVHRSRPWGRVIGLALVLGALLFLAACSDDDEPDPTTTTTTTSTSSTTTTTEAPTLSMLTGLPIEDDEILERPVVAVKISSDANARPQVGFDVADVVVEELVEGVSRFLVIFQSTDSDPVGPMRSARTSEIELLPVFGRPIFAHSGGNPGTMAGLRNANTSVNAGPDSAFGYLQFRDSSRPRPNNLFTNTSALREAASEDASPPTDWFSFLGEDDELSDHALPTPGVDIAFGATRTRWVWDDERQVFLRWHNGTPHVDPDDEQLGFESVVILNTQYGTSPADPSSPEALSIGSGDAWVLSGGHVVSGTWERTERHAPYVVRDADGNEIALSPGRIWISLPRAGNVTFLESDPRDPE